MVNHPTGWPLLYKTPLGMICLYGKVMLIAPKEYCFWSRSLRIFGNAATITNGKSASEPKALTIMLIIVGFKAFLSTQGQQRKHFIRQSCPCASWFGYNLNLHDGNKHVLEIRVAL